MYLKNLALRGFKTFADKTVIEFTPPGSITAIVGPNGCGKSNLVDAIRWVLGEQNPKELRSPSLENVIFAGSSDRKPLSLAEVSIDMDNTDNKIKTEFGELSIKRRTFRSGESDFFINKANCRLKDIRDLFLDTGLGAGSYSIISQGKVDAVLSSKPEDRREIFEEAAKINKYKFRKTAAERKLISTEQNMLRIADLKSEIANQLTVLEDQSRKAAQFLELKEKLKVLEVGLSKRQIKNLNEKKKTLDEKIAALKSQMELGLNLTQQHEENKMIKKEELRHIDSEIENLRLLISQAKLSFEENKSLILLEKEKKRNLEERIHEAQSQHNELSVKLKSLKERTVELESEISSINGLKKNLEDELAALETKVEELGSRDSALEKESDELKGSIFEKESCITEKRNESVELESNLRLAKEEAKHDASFIEKLGSQRSELTQRIAELKGQFSELDSRLKGSEQDDDPSSYTRETLTAQFGKASGIAASLASRSGSYDLEMEIAYGPRPKVNSVSLNGQAMLADGHISGGSLKDKVSGIFRKEREINTLIEHAKTGHDLEAKEAELKNVIEEAELINKSLQARTLEIENIAGRSSSVALEVRSAEEELKVMNAKLASLGEALKAATSEKDSQSASLTELKVKYAGVSSKSENISSEISKNSSEIESISEIISSRRREEMQERHGQTITKIAELEASLPKLIEEEKNCVSRLSSQQASRVKIEKEIDEIDKLLSGGTSQDRVVRDALAKEEVALAKLEGELSAIAEKMMNEYNMSIEAIVASEYDIPINRSKEEAEVLRRSIADLGPVNLLATDEFEKARERFNFIDTQYNDLVLARENLSVLIKELDEKARKDFIDTLKIINANFSEIFAKLFEGGEAKLEIPEGQDVLESGIEIVARPGGKRWLNLSAMSGGERTLTGIALLFALLKTHPSPFCLLDEADAALDEANVHRFTRMLREFAQTTQVVLITHNKQTMQIADIMYGITMEEPGVSKVVSVKLAKAA